MEHFKENGRLGNARSKQSSAQGDDSEPEEDKAQKMEQQAFDEIFGTRTTSMNVEAASKVILDTLAVSPDGSKEGCARFTGQLTKYVHKKGSRKIAAAVSLDPMMDYELFSGQMKNLRHWSEDKCFETWTDLSSNKAIDSDMCGPRESPLCLRVPAYLVGGRGIEDKTENFEERALDVARKTGNLTQENHEALVKECGVGFGSVTMSMTAARQSTNRVDIASITADAITQPRPRQILLDVAASVPCVTPGASSASPDGSPQKIYRDGMMSPPPDAKKPRVDLGLMRTAETRTANTKNSAEYKKTWKALVAACLTLGKEGAQPSTAGYKLLEERLKIGLAFSLKRW